MMSMQQQQQQQQQQHPAAPQQQPQQQAQQQRQSFVGSPQQSSAKQSTASSSPLSFTPTAVMRKMTAEKDKAKVASSVIIGLHNLLWLKLLVTLHPSGEK